MNAPLSIRLATAADCPAINAIYNHYVLKSTCTYQMTVESLAGRIAWLEQHDALHPVTVAEQEGVVVGWGSLSRFHPREAFVATVENAVYVDPLRRGQGIGNALLVDLIDRAQKLGHHTIIALIGGDQTASLRLHENLGFLRAGELKAVGFKLNRWLDLVYMQKLLRVV